ncbi:ATP-binding protein, partial [Streptomyces rochei]
PTVDYSVETTPFGLSQRRSMRGDLTVAWTPDRPAGQRAPEPAAHGARSGESEVAPVPAASPVPAVPPDASFAGLAAFATAGRDAGPATGAAPPPGTAGTRDTTTGGQPTEHRTEESD